MLFLNHRPPAFRLLLLTAAVLAHPVAAELTALEGDELEAVNGASGIEIDVNYATSQDITYIPGPDSSSSIYRLIFGETNFDWQFTGLGVDVIDLGGGFGGAVNLSLPSEISFQNFTTGILNISLDSVVGNSSAPPLPDPVQTYFQVVASSAQDLSQVGPQTMNDNDYFMEIQDVSRDNAGTLVGSGNLRIHSWDRPSGGSKSESMELCNSSGSGCSNQGGTFLTTSGQIARYNSGYGYINLGYWENAPVDGYAGLSAPGANHGAFGSANTTPHTRDSRVLISVEKETDLRVYMDNTACYLAAFVDTTCNYSSSDPDVLDPAVVLLDSSGNFIAGDVSSGGQNNCSGAIGGGGICTDDTDKVANALMNVSIGDKYLNPVPDRRLGGAILGAPPEAANNVVPQQSILSNRASIYLGGGVQVFGTN